MPCNEYSFVVFYSIASDGLLSANANNLLGVRPVVYLSADVEIDSGTGTELDPYVLKNNN